MQLNSCCFSPIDFIDETDRRWTFAACSIILATTLLSETVYVVQFDLQDDPTRYKWVSGKFIFVLTFNDILINVTKI